MHMKLSYSNHSLKEDIKHQIERDRLKLLNIIQFEQVLRDGLFKHVDPV